MRRHALLLLVMHISACGSPRKGPLQEAVSPPLTEALDIGTSTLYASASSASAGGPSLVDSGNSVALGTPRDPVAASSRGHGGDAVEFTGSLPATGEAHAAITVAGQASRTVHVYVPSSRTTQPPLLIVLHGTGDSGRGVLQNYLVVGPSADRNGFVVAAPTALARAGTPADPDHYETIQYATGWNVVDQNPDTNEDLLLLRATIESARKVYAIDSSRIYLMGFSNGAFFAYFAAMKLNSLIAAFAEIGGGAIPCENRGASAFRGAGADCATLAKEPGYPNCGGRLKPVAIPAERVPRAFLAHGNQDYTVSVAWTCELGKAMGGGALIRIYPGLGHEVPKGFVDEAWAFLSSKTLR